MFAFLPSSFSVVARPTVKQLHLHSDYVSKFPIYPLEQRLHNLCSCRRSNSKYFESKSKFREKVTTPVIINLELTGDCKHSKLNYSFSGNCRSTRPRRHVD